MATAFQVGLDVDDKQVRALLDRAPEAFRVRLRSLIEGAAIDTQREMRIASNVGVTGHLRGSVRYQLDLNRFEATVWPDIDYAEDVEKGRGPVKLSVAPGTSLRQWADFKGLNPYAVQAGIAKRGTKPHPFVAPTYDKMKPLVEADIVNGISAFAREANDGSV